MRRNRWLAGVAILAVMAWVGWMGARGRADEKAVADKAAADTASNSAHEELVVGADGSITVPNGTPEELFAFIDRVNAIEPPHDATEIKSFVAKTRGAMLQAANKVLASNPDSKIRYIAIRVKAQALNSLDQYADDASAGKQLRDLIAGLQDDKQPEVARLAAQYRLPLKIHDLLDGSLKSDEARKLWGEVKARLAAEPDNLENIETALTAAEGLGFAKDSSLAMQAQRDLSELLATSTEPEIVNAIRRLALPGHTLKLQGTLVNGQPLDAAALKGKVVLLDFWATWCGPCRAELPNVKKNYEKFHDKGFDVVGISLDDDREALEKFLSVEKIRWPIIFDDAGQHGFDLPLAVRLGVVSIPTTILINQKGEVVSLNARGKNLGKLLEELLAK